MSTLKLTRSWYIPSVEGQQKNWILKDGFNTTVLERPFKFRQNNENDGTAQSLKEQFP